MDAYAKIDKYREDFDDSDFCKKTVKGKGSDDFTTLGPGVNQNLELGKDDALYLYGGRTALSGNLKALRAKDPSFRVKGKTGDGIAIFHDKINASGKTKRILMIAHATKARLTALKGKMLVEPTTGFYIEYIIGYIEKILKS